MPMQLPHGLTMLCLDYPGKLCVALWLAPGPQETQRQAAVHAPSNRWLAAGAAGMLACVITAGCTSHSDPAAAPPPSHAATSTPAEVPASASPASATTSSASAPVDVQNLLVSPSVRRELTAAYVAYKQFEPSGIAGTAPNSVYYAFDAATGAHWAMATFQPSAAALHSSPGSLLYNVLVDMQDGGNQGLFMQAQGSAWRVQNAGVPPQCQITRFFPAAVIAVWALQMPACPAVG